MKILSKDEYFDIKIDDDSIACVYLVDNYNAKSFIWTIEDDNKSLELLSSSFDKKYPKTLVEALIKVPRMTIDDDIFNLILKANVTLLGEINKKDFLQFLGLYEWII